MNEEYRVGKVDFAISTDFNERVKHSSDIASSSNWLNIGYFFSRILWQSSAFRIFSVKKERMADYL